MERDQIGALLFSKELPRWEPKSSAPLECNKTICSLNFALAATVVESPLLKNLFMQLRAVLLLTMDQHQRKSQYRYDKSNLSFVN